MSEDLSDEARDEWCARFTSSVRLSVAHNTWAECARRFEAQIEQHRNQYDRDLMGLQMEILRRKGQLEAKSFIEQPDLIRRWIEEELREAFEAGWYRREKQISGTYPIREMAYRAWREGKK
jgi:hypothetical protein